MTYRDRVIADGATAYWRLGETAGTTAVDVIGGANGVIAAGVTLNQPGAIADGDRAMTFDGTNAVTIPNGAYKDFGAGPVSLELWVKTSAQAAWVLDLKTNGGSATAGVSIFADATSLYLHVFQGGGVPALYCYDAVFGYRDNQWHHIVAVIERGTIDRARMYVDGALRNTNDFPSSGWNLSNTLATVIGNKDTSPAGQGFFGQLDEVAIYKTSLTAAQVAAHYAAATPNYRSRVIRDGASAYWRLGESSGLSFADETGNGHTATSGAATGLAYRVPGGLTDGSTGLGLAGTQVVSNVAGGFATGVTCTFEFWLRPAASSPNSYNGIIGNAGGGASVYWNSTTRQINVNQGTDRLNTTPLTLGTLYHVVIAINNGAGTFYINGVTDGTFTGYTNIAVNALFLLGGVGVTTTLLDEVAVYPTAFSASRAADHYAAASVAYSAYSTRVLADGATNYWRLDETTGVTAIDSVASLNGAISGGVTLGQPGALLDGNAAMTFNGTTGKIVTGNITLQAAFTIEGWVKTSAATGQYPVFSNRGVANGIVYAGIAASKLFLYSDGQTPPSVSGLKVLTDNQWHHIAYVSTGALTSLYVDGVLDQSGAQTHVSATGPGGIGFDASSSQLWPGSIDDIAIYPTALTASQIAVHYALGTHAEGSYASRVLTDGASAYWRLGETSGATAFDELRNANGTIVNGVLLGQPGALLDGNKAMAFDAVDDYITVPNGPYAAIGTGPMTIECWVNSTQPYPANNPFLIENGGGANGNGFAVTRPSAIALGFKIANGTTSVVIYGNNFPYDGQWHHFVAVLTRGASDTVQLFIDGVLNNTNAALAAGWNLTSPRALLFGTYSGGEASPTYRYAGGLDEIAIYPLALTASQIQAHYAARTSMDTLSSVYVGVPGWLLPEDFMATRYNVYRQITPSDTVDLPTLTDGILVGGAGNVAVVMEGGGQAVVLALPAGAWVPIAARRINVTGTTATGLVALYVR